MTTPPKDAPSLPVDTLLRVEHLTMRFGGLTAVDDVSFDVARGDITALIGPNGAGKTTVFNCVTGFYKPTVGRLTLAKSPGETWLLERLRDHQISRLAGVARTFQNIRLFGGMTVLENLLVAQHAPLMRASGMTVLGVLGLGGFNRAERAAIEKAKGWLERIGLVDRADDPAADLPLVSIGQVRGAPKSRAPCAPTRCCSASTSRPPASIRARARTSTRCCARSGPTTASRCC